MSFLGHTQVIERVKRINLKRCMKFSEVENSQPVHIFLRIKPLPHLNKLRFKVLTDNSIEVVEKDVKGESRIFKYDFTQIFEPETNQTTLFEESIRDFIPQVLFGTSFLLAAYGATNAGKTYTILGTQENPGVIPRSLHYLFQLIKPNLVKRCNYKPHQVSELIPLSDEELAEELALKAKILNSLQERETLSRLNIDIKDEIQDNIFIQSQDRMSIWVSFVELYNENVYDLLNINDSNKNISNQRPKLHLGEDKKGQVYIKGQKYICVESAQEALDILQFGQKQISRASTKLNQSSSRSHCLFKITIVNHDTRRLSTFTICDLAGCERLNKTFNLGVRLKESQNINKSLLVLRRCLGIIRNNQEITNPKDVQMIPYRESKLTRLLQQALQGQEKFTMIVNVSPDPIVFEETIQVFRFSADAQVINDLKEKIEQMRRDYKIDLEKQLDAQRKDLSEKYKDIIDNIHEMYRKGREIEANQKDFHEYKCKLLEEFYNTKLSEKQEKYDSLKIELESIKSENIDLIEDLKLKDDWMNELSSDLQQKENENNDIIKLLQEAKEEYTLLQNENQSLENTLSEKLTQIFNKEEEIENLKSEKEEILSSHIVEMKKMQDIIFEKTEEISELKLHNEQLTNEMKKFDIEKEETVALYNLELENMKDTICKKTEEINYLKSQNKDLVKTVEDMLASHKDEIKQIQETILKNDIEIEKLKLDNNGRIAEIENINIEKDKILASHRDEIKSMEEIIIKKEDEIKDIKLDIEKILKNNENLKIENENMIISFKEDIKNMEKLISDKNKEIINLKSQSETKEEIESLKDENEKLKKELEKFKSKKANKENRDSSISKDNSFLVPSLDESTTRRITRSLANSLTTDKQQTRKNKKRLFSARRDNELFD